MKTGMTTMDRFAQVCAAPHTDNSGGSGFDKKVFSASTDGGSASSGSSTSSKGKVQGDIGGSIDDSVGTLSRDTGTDGGHSKSDLYATTDSPADSTS